MDMALVPRRFPKYAAGLNIAGTPGQGRIPLARLPPRCGAKAQGNCWGRVKIVSFCGMGAGSLGEGGDFGTRLRDGVSQLAPQDFAGCSLRNGIHEMDGAWLFVSCEAVGDEGAELFS